MAYRYGNHQTHQEKVLGALQAGARTSYDVAQWTRLSRDTASAQLSALKAMGRIRRVGSIRVGRMNNLSYVWALVRGAVPPKLGRPGRPPVGSECPKCKIRWRQDKLTGLCRRCGREEGEARNIAAIQTSEVRPAPVVQRAVVPPVPTQLTIRSAKDDCTGRIVDFEVVFDGTDNAPWGRSLRR